MLQRESPIPLYHQLAEQLMADIRAGVYAAGDRIPSETALASEHSLGRPTVRQALASLVRRGVLIRRRGSGTYVADPPASVDLFSLAGTMSSFREAGLELDASVLQQPALEPVPAAQGDNPFAGGRAYVMHRLSRLGKTPVLVEDIYLDPAAFPGLDRLDLRGQSLSRLVFEHYGAQLEGGEQRFTIGYPDERLAKLLQLKQTAPILDVSRRLHFAGLRDGLFARLYCRTDRCVFTQHLDYASGRSFS